MMHHKIYFPLHELLKNMRFNQECLLAGHGMEWKFWYGLWKMPEWNGMEDFKNEMEDNLPYQFHTRFRALYLQKNTYRCRVVINNIVTEVFNFNIYAYYLSTNRVTLLCTIVHCANSACTQARSQDLEKGGGYFERVRSEQTTLTRIVIALESVSHGLHEN